MKIGVIIQARMSSKRYPSKVLTEVNDKPLLGYVIERLEFSCNYQNIVIATSLQKSDDPIEIFCLEKGLSYFRGDLENVSLRMLQASKANDFDGFVRVNGDSPLLDPHIINQAVSLFNDSDYDLVTNTYPRTFPVGQSVEVVRTKTFERVVEKWNFLRNLST